MPESFHFLQPMWWLALIPLALLLWFLARQSGDDDHAWNGLIDPELLPLLLQRGTRNQRRWPLILTGLGGLLAITALANPVWQQLPAPVFETRTARVIVLDLSLSMYSPDIAPSRLARSKFKLRDLLAQPFEGQTGLVAFAGDAFVVSPLTRDVDTVESMFEALDPNIMPVQGSRLDLAIEKASQLLRQSGLMSGHIIALTDGADDPRAVQAASEAREAGYLLSIVAAGTPAGAPLPNGRGGVIRSRDGKVVMPGLDESRLREIANAGGGQYTRLTSDNSDLNQLSRVQLLRQGQSEVDDLLSDRWNETGPWLSLLLLPLGALAFRKGWLMTLWLPLLLLPTQEVTAAVPGQWFLNPEQQAQKALQAEEYEAALSLTQDPQRQGSALYKLGDFEAAEHAFKQLDTANAHYNRGNSLVQQGKYEEAITAYDLALAKQPGMQDAIDNRALAEALKNQPPAESQLSPQQQDDASQDPQSKESSDTQDNRDPADRKSDEAPPDDQQPGEEQQDSDVKDEKPPSAEAEPSDKPADEPPKDGPQSGELTDRPPASEQEVAADQWLRRIEDDPGELLRRKFMYQYQQRDKAPGSGSQQPW